MNIDQAIQTLKTIKHDASLHDQPTAEQAIDLGIQALEAITFNFQKGYPLFISPELMRSLEQYYSDQLRHALDKQRKH